MILLHGRGATAPSILMLAQELFHPDYAYLAPQAAGDSWYPYSFLATFENNEPWLTSALMAVDSVVQQVEAAGIPAHRLVLGGFSQGACLASEYVARNPRRYGGLIAFSGGLIGPPEGLRTYYGDLHSTPVFLGCSDVDSHIPKQRVMESVQILDALNGAVSYRFYPGMGHTVNSDEIEQAREMLRLVAGNE